MLPVSTIAAKLIVSNFAYRSPPQPRTAPLARHEGGPLFYLQNVPSINQFSHLNLHAVADVTPVPVASLKKLARFLNRFGLDTPFLGSRDGGFSDHGYAASQHRSTYPHQLQSAHEFSNRLSRYEAGKWHRPAAILCRPFSCGSR